MKTKIPDIEFILWHDTYTMGNKGWTYQDDVDEFSDGEMIIATVGFIYNETDDWLTLFGDYHNLGEEGFDPRYNRLLKIPKGCIIKRRKLRLKLKK